MQKKLTIFLVVACLIIGMSVSYSQAYIIKSFDVYMTVNEDGSINVSENINVDFRQKRRGIIRNIPYRYTFEGDDVEIQLANVSVQNHNYQSRKRNGFQELKIGDQDVFLTGPTNYQIQYTLRYPIIHHQNYEELYWNVTGDKWDAPIEKSSITISLPKGVALSSDDLVSFVGRSSSSAEHDKINQSDLNTINAEVTRTLRAGEGFSIAAKFPNGYYNIPQKYRIKSNPNKKSVRKTKEQNPWYLAIPMGLLALLFSWRSKMRSQEITPKFRDKYAYYPPKGVTSVHLGSFIDGTVHNRDVMSLIPYWAAEGFLKMRYAGDLYLEKLEELPDHYPDYEHKLFNAFFIDGDTYKAVEGNGEMAAIIESIKGDVQKEVKGQLYFDEDYLTTWRSWKTFAMGIVPIIAGIVFMLALHNLWLGGGLILMGIILLLSMIQRAPLNPKGKEMMARVKALEQFLKDAPVDETAELIKTNPSYFGQMLPFAVALGIDKSWLKTIEPMMESTPTWFEHADGRQFYLFGMGYNSAALQNKVAYTPPVAPNVSSGGGFGGGGSVGGGFGGGGGSSW